MLAAAGFVSIPCFSFERHVRKCDKFHLSESHLPMTLLNHYFRFNRNNRDSDAELGSLKSKNGYFSRPSHRMVHVSEVWALCLDSSLSTISIR